MTDENRREGWIPPRGEDTQAVPDRPNQDAGQPHLEPKTEGRRDRAVEDGDVPRRAGQQDRLGQGPVQRHLEPREMLPAHETSAPPAKLKKVRKKLEAAKAIERPKTIWISRRNPPEVSPNAKVRPVVMMMMTATIRATGPWTDSRTCCSGSSQGMPEPAANAPLEKKNDIAAALSAEKR